MQYLYIDYENLVTTELRLSKMVSRQYVLQAPITMVAAIVDDQEIVLCPDDDGWADFIRECHAFAADPECCLVAHNAAYDARVWHHSPQSQVEYPQHTHCTLEMAQWCWPSLPGGYGLKNLGETFSWLPKKIDIDLAQGGYSDRELREYNLNDTRMCKILHEHILPQMPEEEVRLLEQASRARELHMDVAHEKVEEATSAFLTLIKDNAALASEYLNDEDAESFGIDDEGNIKSVKPHEVKRLLLDNLGFDTLSISKKKLNPEKLRKNESAAKALEHTGMANKSLSHKRRIAVLRGLDEVDISFMFFAAHTGRWSGRGDGGKGLNIHNLPKRDKRVAKPIRQCYRLPPGFVFVRCDAANLEYRTESWVTEAFHPRKLFLGDLFADPYVATWIEAIGQVISKSDPERQVAKAMVLGLGYLMGVGTWIAELLRALADPALSVGHGDLVKIAETQGWDKARLPGYVRAQQKKHHTDHIVATVAMHTHQAFHDLHPEFRAYGDWLELLARKVNHSLNPERVIDKFYDRSGAPPREKLDLRVRNCGSERNIEARCGLWPHRTVVWRNLAIRETPFGAALTSVQAGRKKPRALTRNILIENTIQSCARNMVGEVCLRLEDLGYPYILNVHDEVLLVVPEDRDCVIQAKKDLLKVAGPGNTLGYEWAMLFKESDVNVSRSWYEDEDITDKTWWSRLESGDPDVWKELP